MVPSDLKIYEIFYKRCEISRRENIYKDHVRQLACLRLSKFSRGGGEDDSVYDSQQVKARSRFGVCEDVGVRAAAWKTSRAHCRSKGRTAKS